MFDTPQSPVSDELLDALFKHYEKPEDFFGKSGIFEQLTKRVVERALQAELSHHLGHEKHGTVMNNERNTRNGRSKKKRSGASMGTLKSTSHATARAALSRNSCKSIRRTGRASMTMLFLYIPEE